MIINSTVEVLLNSQYGLEHFHVNREDEDYSLKTDLLMKVPGDEIFASKLKP